MKKLAIISVLSAIALSANAAPLVTIGDQMDIFFRGAVMGSYNSNVTYAHGNKLDDYAGTLRLGGELDYGRTSKFKANIKIVGPAALIVSALYVILGWSVSVTPDTGYMQWILLIPYIAVIALALSGMNVAAVLTIGLFINAVLGFSMGNLSWSGWLESIGEGISGMGDLIIVTVLAGGMLELIKENGGLDFIVNGMTRRINGKRGAEFSIAGLVSLANLCTANNTIAIITSGGIARDITEKFGLDPRKTASILDTFSCLIQGFIPYGAQLLMAAGLAEVSSISIIGYLYYPLVMGIFAIGAIIFRLPRKM
jgi:Na+/H+ antiporter NhaC